MNTQLEEHPSFTRAQSLDEPWRSHFPKTLGEAQRFEPMVERRALGFRVLCVARTRIECAWCAYCDAVPGKDHEVEMQEVLRTGTKMPEDTARSMFPRFNEVPYAL